MGHIMHSVLAKFNLQNIKTQPMKAKRVIKAAGTDTIIIELSNGSFSFATQGRNIEKWAYPADVSRGWQAAFLDGLKRLGHIDKDDAKAISEEAAAYRKKKDEEFAAEQITQCADALGLKLTKAQQLKVNAAKRVKK